MARRPAASTFIWEKNSPLNSVPGPKFSAHKNALALHFALRAIAAQPGSYLADVLRDASLSFYWNNPDHPSPAMAHGTSSRTRPRTGYPPAICSDPAVPSRPTSSGTAG